MQSLIINLILSHKDYIVGAAIGFGFAHISTAFDYAFDFCDKFPVFHNFIVKYSKEEEAAIEVLATEAKKKIEEAKSKDVPHS